VGIGGITNASLNVGACEFSLNKQAQYQITSFLLHDGTFLACFFYGRN
jgi:hypothetical protein